MDTHNRIRKKKINKIKKLPRILLIPIHPFNLFLAYFLIANEFLMISSKGIRFLFRFESLDEESSNQIITLDKEKLLIP